MPKYRPKGKRARAAMERPPTGGSAVIVGRYRYSLTRWWEGDTNKALRSRVAWVMLNPSKADALEDDPTIGRVTGFSKAWGHTSFEVVNPFAYRTPDPEHLWSRRCDIVGRMNDAYIRQAIHNADRVVVAWGTGGAKADRAVMAERVAQVVAMMRPHGIRAQCLGTNQDGSPKHPLYLRADTKLEPWPETLTPSPLFSYSPSWLERNA